MISLNNRIRSSEVHLGKSVTLENKKFILSKEGLESSKEDSPEEIREKKRKKQEMEAQKAIEAVTAEAQKQAEDIIEKAKQKAEEIKQSAEDEAGQQAEEIENLKNQSIENGYAEGYQKGYDEGIEAAKQEVNDKINAVDIITSASFKVKKEIIDSAEKEILELSTLIAEKIIRQQLEYKPELMREIVKSAIDQLQDKEEIKIIVNPSLAGILYEFAEDLKEKIKGLKNIKITEDRTIPPDGVIVESNGSRIDGRMETQVAEITRKLINEFTEKINSQEIPEEIEVKINDKLIQEKPETESG